MPWCVACTTNDVHPVGCSPERPSDISHFGSWRLSEARCLRISLPRAPIATQNRGLRHVPRPALLTRYAGRLPRAHRDGHLHRRPAVRRSSWAAGIVHAKARKTPTNNPARARLIEQMKRMAEFAEKEQVDATPEVDLASPLPAVRVSRQETAVCQPPQRSVFGSEACAAVVDSPVAPLGRI